jgi:hypothetical protein
MYINISLSLLQVIHIDINVCMYACMYDHVTLKDNFFQILLFAPNCSNSHLLICLYVCLYICAYKHTYKHMNKCEL